MTTPVRIRLAAESKARGGGEMSWLQHRGGVCPVSSETKVGVLLRDGSVLEIDVAPAGGPTGPVLAGSLAWEWPSHAWAELTRRWDIIGYRTFEPGEPRGRGMYPETAHAR